MYARKMFAVLLITFGVFYFVFAEDNKDVVGTKEYTHKAHNFHGMKEKGMMPGMPKGMSRSMVASSDGGVFVLAGNKLQKYDKNLVLQKEVEIKMPMDMMQIMQKKCPMMEGDSESAQMESSGLRNESAKVSK